MTRTALSRAEPDRRVVSVALAVLLLALGIAAVLVLPGPPLGGRAMPSGVPQLFTPAQHARENAFHSALRGPSYGALALSLVVAAVLGLTPLGARLVAAVARPLGGGWAWRVLLGTVALEVVGTLATLPLSAQAEQVLRRYGLSSRSWAGWLADVGRGLAVTTVVTALALLVLVALARRLPRTWWAWGAAVVALLVVAGSFGYPLVVEPLFNSFTPLPAGQLRTELLALARRDGVPVQDVLVADASRRTTALNAYVSGFGPSRRIVLYDTLLRSATPAEIRLVVAHELGHAKADDVLTGTLLGALGAAAGVCALALVLSVRPLLRRAGVAGPGDARVIALVLLLVQVGTLLTDPVVNLASRRIEARADVHALNLTRDSRDFIASQVRLAVSNLSDLDPPGLAHLWFGDHPSVSQRIAVAELWQRLHQ